LLAGLEPSQTEPDERAIMSLADRFSEMSQVVFILLGWDSMNQQLVELAERASCYCTVVLIGDAAGNRASAQPIPTWAGTIRVLSPQDVLSGQVKAL